MSFVHLEVHSHLSLLRATPSIDQLVERAAGDGMARLALTDTNALYGAVAFARACRARNIHPIIGMTVTLQRPDGLALAGQPEDAAPGHLVLLARNRAGYASLCRLATLIQGHPDREEVAARGLAWADIAAHREGLICLSGGRMGWVDRFLAAGDGAAALAFAGRLAGTFDENACLALEWHGPEDAARLAQIADIGRRLGMPLVAVQPVYCLTPEDAALLPLLAAIRANRPLDLAEGDEEPPDDDGADDWDERGEGDGPAAPRAAPGGQTGAHTTVQAGGGVDCDGHWLAPAEIAARFAAYPDAVAAAAAVAERCGEVLPDGRPIWPSLALPPGETPETALRKAAIEGMARRYAGPQPLARLEKELLAIDTRGFAPLFLVVAGIVRHAREQEIPVSTRGSVANSLVAYCTGITTVDPIEHDLLFERFLSPARADLPDLDLDFCSERRDEVLRYVRDHYGADHVALVCTISTLRPQSAAREVAKAYGLDEREAGRIAALMPGRWHPDPRRRDERTIEDVLPLIDDPRSREVAQLAWRLVGTPDHLSVHPGGLVITPGPLTDVVPLQWAPKGFLVTQYEHGDVEAIGLPKLDLLGIRALTVLADAVALVRRTTDPAFDLEGIPLDDGATADLISRAETIGVFQCESEGAQRTLWKLKARSIRDLAIANAFFKPGPARGGMADAFVRRHRGEAPVTYSHMALKPILGPTKGVLIFQEQVLRLATEVAGLSWEQADRLRRGMSHFRREEMISLQEAFIAGCCRPAPEGTGMARAQAQRLWDQIVPFSGYGFNQGHATAYAAVSYRCAYIKAHYPAQYLAARLASSGGFYHPAIYMAEALRMGFGVRPPHVNHSGLRFTLVAGPAEEGGLRPPPPDTFDLYMGLGQVRDLRRSAAEAIVAARRDGPFGGLRDLRQRVDLQPKEVDHLVRCGALDGLGSRRALLQEAGTLRRRGDIDQLAFAFEEVDEVPPEPLSQRWAWEQELLGLPVSALCDPLALVRDRLPPHTSLADAMGSTGRSLIVPGIRLPGWTGGPGFFLGDGRTRVLAHTPRGGKNPPPFQPLLVHGWWHLDEWGWGCLQATKVEMLDTA